MKKVAPGSFRQWVMAPYPLYKRETQKQARAGKRRRAQAVLRTKVLLYGEPSPDEAKITAVFNDDLAQPVDALSADMP